LITGAAGTVGSELASILLEQGVPFRAGVHSRPLETEGVESVTFDYKRSETLRKAMEGVRAVYLVFLMTWAEQQMVSAARNVIAAARQSGVSRIVKQSAYAAGEEGYPHARWHRRVEQDIEGSGLSWTFLRPNGFMQTLLAGWAKSIRAEGKFSDSVEGACYAPIDARDIARVATHALTEDRHAGQVYELTGPARLSWQEAAETLSRVLCRTVHYELISDETMRQGLLAEGYSEEIAEAWVDVNRYARKNPSLVTTCVKDITGRDPVSFDLFCQEYAHLFALDA
jgi:uncharacterized protein YbjT (DUF2867 family)